MLCGSALRFHTHIEIFERIVVWFVAITDSSNHDGPYEGEETYEVWGLELMELNLIVFQYGM